jgi:hypothetical protein
MMKNALVDLKVHTSKDLFWGKDSLYDKEEMRCHKENVM